VSGDRGTRFDLAGVTRPGAAFEIDLEGRPLPAFEGETIAAAMIAAGIYRFRDSDGEGRGLFCGMGVCGECQVLVDGRSRRACLEKAGPGMRVKRHPARRSAGQTEAVAGDREWSELATDVLVVGGGPAGLAAAEAAATRGLDVVLVDERQQPGGQYYKQPPAAFVIEGSRLDRQFRGGMCLARRAREAGIDYRAPVTVVGGFAGRRVAVASDTGMLMIRARRIVVATGAYERPLPFPGWTLPGVMTTGAAQTLLRGYQVLPGRRVLVAGNGPLNLQVADELGRAGAEVVAVAELAPSPWRRPAAATRLFVAGPRLAAAGLGHVAALARRRVPLLYGHALVRVAGEERNRRATLAALGKDGRPRPGSERRFDVDAVCLNYGFLPQGELARALGCAYRRDAATGDVRSERGLDGRSSVAEVFVVGDAGGLGGAKLALAQGRLAGTRIAADLAAASRPAPQELARLEREIRGHRRFQDALWALFAAPRLMIELASAETLVCRCESLSLGALGEAVAAGSGSLAAVKKLTRAGMGRCQGRYCAGPVNAILGGSAGSADDDFFAPRPPLKPVPIGLLAGRTGAPPEPRDLLAGVAEGGRAGTEPG